jgi:hypothetical protein
MVAASTEDASSAALGFENRRFSRSPSILEAVHSFPILSTKAPVSFRLAHFPHDAVVAVSRHAARFQVSSKGGSNVRRDGKFRVCL